MKETIKARLKALFPDANLSAKRINEIVARLEADKVADEATAVDAALNSLNSGFRTFSDIAKSDDAERTRELKIKELESKLPTKTDKTEEPEVPADTPAWAKALIESNKTLSTKLAQMEGEKSQQTIKQKIAEQLKGKDGKDGVPEALWSKRQLPQKEDEIEAFVTDVKADHATIAQTYTNHQLGQSGRPAGGQSNSTTAAKVHPDVQRFMEQQKAKQEASPVKTATTTI